MKSVLSVLMLVLTIAYSKVMGIQPPVDEAKVDKTIVENQYISFNFGDEGGSSDPTKTTDINGEITVYQDKLKLSSAKKSFIIKIKEAFDVPNTLTIHRGDNNISSKDSDGSRVAKFIVLKSDLKINDKIIVRTNSGDKVVEIEVIK